MITTKLFKNQLKLLLVSPLALVCCSCTIRFTNAGTRVEPELRRVYVPAATDASAVGGNSGRISYAVRKLLAQNTRFVLTSASEARWGIDIHVLERRQRVTTIEECTPTVRTVGAGAFQCSDAEKSIHLPTRTAEREGIGMRVRVIAIDLKNGATIDARTIEIPESSNTFPVVSEKDSAGLAIRSNLQRTPQLHALRYAENRDAAVDNIASRIAAEVVSMMEGIGSRIK